MTTVFISWSGEKSQKIAEELRTWIPSVLQFAQPYFTPRDIEKGTKWNSEISKKLSESSVGIICLTKDNLQSPWILFEAGALSKDINESRVCTLLCGIENTDVTGPLTTFQSTSFEKSDVRDLLLTINDSGKDKKLSTDTFERVFEKWWPDIERSVQEIISSSGGNDDEVRSDREILEELLSLTREQPHRSFESERQHLLSRIAALEDIEFHYDKHILEELVSLTSGLVSILDTKYDSATDQCVRTLIPILRTLSSNTRKGYRHIDSVKELQIRYEEIVPF